MSEYARYAPSEASLKMAVDLYKNRQWSTQEILALAAAFDAYLFADLVVGISAENGALSMCFAVHKRGNDLFSSNQKNADSPSEGEAS